MRGYLRIPVELPEQPEIKRIVDEARRTIYINTAAKKGANIITVIPAALQWTWRPQ